MAAKTIRMELIRNLLQQKSKGISIRTIAPNTYPPDQVHLFPAKRNGGQYHRNIQPHKGARRAAMAYSYFAMCKAHQVNPHQWLKYTLQNIMSTRYDNIRDLYP